MIVLQFDDVCETRFPELSSVGGSDAVFASVRNMVTVNWPTAHGRKLEKITTKNDVNPTEELLWLSLESTQPIV
jgi:hypothetical protein